MSDFGPPVIPGTGMGGTNPLLAKILEQGDAQRADSTRAEADFKASREREQAARATQTAAMAPQRAALRTTLQQVPQVPEVKPVPEAPKAPAIDPKEMNETLSLITALAAIGSLGQRKPLTAALNNFTAGVHGYVQGKQDVYTNSLKEFDANVKKASAENDAVWKKYAAAKDKHGTDVQALQNEMQIIAAETQSPIDQELAARGDIVSLLKMRETANSNYTKVLQSAATMGETARAHAETERHNKVSEGELSRHNKAAEAVASQKLATNDALAKGDFTPADVTYWAEVLQKGGDLPPRLANTPGGKKLVADIMKQVTSSGVKPSEMLANKAELMGLKAAERTAGTKIANIEMAVKEAENMASIVLDTSKNFSRTNFMPINKALKAYEDNTGSTESRQFGAALNSFINAYARAISPSGTPTVSDKEHAREMLSTADSHKQIEAVMGTLKQEMAAAQKSPHQVKEALREGFVGKPVVPKAGGFEDPEKERRYQEWKAKNGG